jgi:phage gp45-like
MHRATPANSSFRAYSAGGARATVSGIDDSKLMQEISGAFMKGESRGKIEHAQQYGFTAVPFDPDKGEDGKEGLGPETFISFMGGNRSFPVAGAIDDRRHRLKGLEKGDVALFRGKDDGQQFHMNGVGTFLSSYPGKKLRMQLVQKAQQAAGQAPGQQAEAGGGAGGQAGGGEQKATGQSSVYKQESSQYFEVTGDVTESMNKKHVIMLDDKEIAVNVRPAEGGHPKGVYLGGRPELGHQFSPVVTVAGPSAYVFARIG